MANKTKDACIAEAKYKVALTKKIHYLVSNAQGYTVTALSPHCLEWKKYKYEWHQTFTVQPKNS